MVAEVLIILIQLGSLELVIVTKIYWTYGASIHWQQWGDLVF